MKRLLKVGDKIKFVSGNFEGKTAVVIEVDFSSKNPKAMFGYYHKAKLSDGFVVCIEKNEHWKYL